MIEKINAFEKLLETMRDNPQTDDITAQWLHRLLGNVRKVHGIARQQQFSRPPTPNGVTPDMMGDLREAVRTISKAAGVNNYELYGSGGFRIEWKNGL